MEQQVKDLAVDRGATHIGIATCARLADAPPSGDAAYLLPSARSVVAFAVALNPQIVRGFISKKSWSAHCEDRKEVVQRLYKIGDAIVEFLRAHGHDAINVDINNNYRPEEGAADVTEMTKFHPTFSHRYAAVAAGIGRLGWSGNLMTPEHGALVELGSVLTSAELAPDPLLEENPCDRCMSCAQVCPVGMINPKAGIEVTVAGITDEIAAKRQNTCCWIGCTGYEGLSASGKWSNWSPYRLVQPLPEDDQELDELCISLQKADPQMQDQDANAFADYRKSIFDPDWFYYTVCGFCRSVCWAQHGDRRENRRLIRKSGTAALALDGMHVVAGPEATEHQTPFLVKVVVAPASPADTPGSATAGRASTHASHGGRSPMDKEVLRHLRRNE